MSVAALLKVAVVAAIALIAGELFLYLAYPQVISYPRWRHSRAYCYLLPENTTIVHERPRHWKFTYMINEYGCRGAVVPISNSYMKSNIVVLGDSYSMGAGVNDGEEYAAVLGRRLAPSFNVVNAGVPGWGLAQEIRRFYEFGRLYDPRLVVLQFCSNDPLDNLTYGVTSIEDGRFVFRDATGYGGRIARLLARSRIVQHMQLYNFFRNIIVARRHSRIDAAQPAPDAAASSGGKAAITLAEALYSELLDLFARDLAAQRSKLIFLEVNAQLKGFPFIEAKVDSLEAAGLLTHFDAGDWLQEAGDVRSPEGHLWGASAHRIVGEHLAEAIAAIPVPAQLEHIEK